jgi:hypothetical protein
VIDHDTGMEMLETRRYRVRADELQSIDEDGIQLWGVISITYAILLSDHRSSLYFGMLNG